MTYKVEIDTDIKKQLLDVPKNDVKKILKRIEKLANAPFPPGHEKLQGMDNLYRVRQGDYRILYSVFDDKLLVLVLKIGHRREVYR